jgi:tRNA pseudouridine13 synthase
MTTDDASWSTPEGVRTAVLAPPLVTAALPGIGGRLRVADDDFVVDEIPAYPPDGKPGWLMLQLRKRGMSTEDAVRAVARALDIPVPDVGYAGRKDRDAITRQWISVPARVAPSLAALAVPGLELGPAYAHSHKLRTGHLRGNRFAIVVRALACTQGVAIERAADKLAMLVDTGGLPNSFGPQRFGNGGVGIDRGLVAMRAGRGGPRGNMTVASGQAVLFNLYLLRRAERGLLRRALVGDVLKKTETGGLFVCTDADADSERLEAGELVVTGPIFGSRTMGPPRDTPSWQLEQEILDGAEVSREALARLGRAALGTRRPLFVPIVDATVEPVADPTAIALGFTLPAGAFATSLCRELQSPSGDAASDTAAPASNPDVDDVDDDSAP